MTEEEARNKVCNRQWIWNFNAQQMELCASMCIASDCMLWKWSDWEFDDKGECVYIDGDCGLKR